MAAEANDPDFERTYLYHQLDNYPWNEDEEFQGGLRAILGSVQDPAQIEHLTLRAKCYYYARKAGTTVDFDGYKHWVETGHLPLPNGSNDTLQTSENIGDTSFSNDDNASGIGGLQDAPKPASFAEICEMIAEGKPIPGIKDIPDTILEGQASESQTQKRRKPWEKDAGVGSREVGRPSWMVS